MKKWYKIAFNAKMDEDDILAMKGCFFQAMDEAMGIEECSGLEINGDAEEWCAITFFARLDESDLRAMNAYLYQTMEDAMDISECAGLEIEEEKEGCPSDMEILTAKANELRREAYRRYQLDWMMCHGYSLEDLADQIIGQTKELCSLEEIQKDNGEIFSQWESDGGFYGSLYVSFEEFLFTEYRDPDYMNYLLPDNLFSLWMQLESEDEEE